MTSDFVKLVVKGAAGCEFSVQQRSRDEEPQQPMIQAALPERGSATVILPRGYYVVIAPGATVPADFLSKEERELVVTIPAK